MRGIRKYLVFVPVVGTALPAFATNGLYLAGSGPSSLGMAGASIAFAQDTTAAADNPAGMAMIGNRFEAVGILVTAQTRSTFGSSDNEMKSRMNVPALGGGVNYQLSPEWTIGASVTGAGIGVDYGRPVLPAPGAGVAKATIAIANVAPTVTYSPNPALSLGASLVIGLQQFRAKGVVAPTPDGGLLALPSHGNAFSVGAGVGLGVMWKPLPTLSLGTSIFSKTRFGSLSGYKEDLLGRTGGHLDLPPRYGVGVAWNPAPDVTIAFDYLRINWARSDALGDQNSFNWHNQNVFRGGVSWKVDDSWTVRAGYSRVNSYADSEHTPANFFAAGINNRTLAAGFTYSVDKTSDVTFGFEYNIPRTLNGTGPASGTNIRSGLQSFMLGYSRKF